MKVVVLALGLLVASVNAWPQSNYGVVKSDSRNIVADIVVSLIEEYMLLIQRLGLDPYYLGGIEGEIGLPVSGIFSTSGQVSSVSLEGIGDVTIHGVNFNDQTRELYFDLSYPLVSGSVGSASGEVNILDGSLTGQGSGSLVIKEVRATGTTILNINLNGIYLETFNVAFKIGSIESNLNLVLLGYDISDFTNNFLSNTLINFLNDYQSQISIVVEHLVLLFIDGVL